MIGHNRHILHTETSKFMYSFFIV